MSAVATASNGLTRLRDRARLGAGLERIFGSAILLGLVVWVVANFAKDAGQTFATLLSGVSNGALYALIALGYTMVYGIIELINFAHGDLFMLGTVVSANILINWLGVHTAGLEGLGGLL